MTDKENPPILNMMILLMGLLADSSRHLADVLESDLYKKVSRDRINKLTKEEIYVLQMECCSHIADIFIDIINREDSSDITAPDFKAKLVDTITRDIKERAKS